MSVDALRMLGLRALHSLSTRQPLRLGVARRCTWNRWCVREHSSAAPSSEVDDSSHAYQDTLLLPNTAFPQRANAVKREPSLRGGITKALVEINNVRCHGADETEQNTTEHDAGVPLRQCRGCWCCIIELWECEACDVMTYEHSGGGTLHRRSVFTMDLRMRTETCTSDMR